MPSRRVSISCLVNTAIKRCEARICRLRPVYLLQEGANRINSAEDKLQSR